MRYATVLLAAYTCSSMRDRQHHVTSIQPPPSYNGAKTLATCKLKLINSQLGWRLTNFTCTL